MKPDITATNNSPYNWWYSGSPRLKKFKTQKSAGKVMATDIRREGGIRKANI